MNHLAHTLQLAATIRDAEGNVSVNHEESEQNLFSVYERQEGQIPFEWIADFLDLDAAEDFVYARAARTGAKVLYQVPGGTPQTIDEASSKYVRDLGLICPVCESNDIRVDAQLEVDTARAWGECHCENCRSTWLEIYTLSGIGDLETPDQRAERLAIRHRQHYQWPERQDFTSKAKPNKAVHVKVNESCTYNGGTVIDGAWYSGITVQPPIVPEGYELRSIGCGAEMNAKPPYRPMILCPIGY